MGCTLVWAFGVTWISLLRSSTSLEAVKTLVINRCDCDESKTRGSQFRTWNRDRNGRPEALLAGRVLHDL